MDSVDVPTVATVVPNHVQATPLLIGHPVTEDPNVVVYKDAETLQLFKKMPCDGETRSEVRKVCLWPTKNVIIRTGCWGNICVDTKGAFEGDLYIEASLRSAEGQECCIPRTILTICHGTKSFLPFVNLSDQDIMIKSSNPIVRGWPCEREAESEKDTVLRIDKNHLTPITADDVTVGPITEDERTQLISLLNKYRSCFACNIDEIGCAKSTEVSIHLEDDKPFTYRPYHMSRSEQDTVRGIVDDLVRNNIVQESCSPYSSPILLVRKKNGEQRMCIDYRRLNQATVKDRYPLPRIDDQLDKLQGSTYYTSLDLRSGYHQIPIAEESKKYTAFVTPDSQYEFNRLPFGLTNAPSVFQRLMNKVLRPAKEIAAVYLDDVLIYSKTIREGIENLERVLKLLQDEGLTLNPEKCKFMMTSVEYLGFEISDSKVQPGRAKINAVKEFTEPKTVHEVRQFLGLTGYFRHFVKNYAQIARPLTNLTRKNEKWRWTDEEQKAYETLKNTLVERPILVLYDPKADTEVHTDASSRGLAGILLQKQSDGRLHPVSYFSRKTTPNEEKYHSYELETLAVVESLKKFRGYLLGIHFTVVTDCNSLKATSTKKQLLPRIARWWLQLQEYSFTVQYRPGDRMKHVDALSRNPSTSEQPTEETVMRIEQDDWVLSAQLTDDKIQQILETLSKPPETDQDRDVYKNYALRNGRVYRITVKGLQWVVPRGMRQQVVRAAHDDLGHFAVEKTLHRLCQHYWFPRMRQYVEKYIACCIPCIYGKKASGRKEGLLHPITKVAEPFDMLHIDHYGPLPKSTRGNVHVIVVVEAFSKFTFLKAVKSTNTKYVISFLEEIFVIYGTPRVLVSDRGSSFTSKKFCDFCRKSNIKHILNAVATPRANGQVERFNRTLKSVLLTTCPEEDRWDTYLHRVQYAINNVVNKSTGKTASELLHGFRPRGGVDSLLIDEVDQLPRMIEDIVAVRQAVGEKLQQESEAQKERYDKKRKPARKYKEGDLVVIEKQEPCTSSSRKMTVPYSGPMVVKEVLPNDRYIVCDMPGSGRTRRKANYKNVVAVDHMKPWLMTGGVSDDTDEESGSDGVPLSEESEDDETQEMATKASGRG